REPQRAAILVSCRFRSLEASPSTRAWPTTRCSTARGALGLRRPAGSGAPRTDTAEDDVDAGEREVVALRGRQAKALLALGMNVADGAAALAAYVRMEIAGVGIVALGAAPRPRARVSRRAP